MNIDSSTTSQKTSERENKSNIMSKFSITQNAIKKKFEKAIENRLASERDAVQAMNPLTPPLPPSAVSLSRDSFSRGIVSSLHNLSKSEAKLSVHQPRLSAKLHMNNATVDSRIAETHKEEQHDTSMLCNRLRLLLSSPFADDVHHIQEISIIITKLRDMGILL